MRLILLISLLLLACGVHGQTLYGIVVNGETAKPLPAVMVINVSTQQSVVTDTLGNYTISARYGDIVSYSFPEFHTIQRVANPEKYSVTELFPLSVRLKEYVLHSDYTPFQQDSAELTTLYGKELNTQRVKPGFSNANGGGFSGVIGSVVQKHSKSYKQNKRFKETFQKDIEQKFIDTRYTPRLVQSLTGLTGDTLIMFMNSYPMAYDFARRGTDLELKMWIRDNYKQYLKHNAAAH